MITKKGVTGLNAETTIDLEKEEVGFSYPVLKTTKEFKRQIQLGYAGDYYIIITGVIATVIVYFISAIYYGKVNNSSLYYFIYALSMIMFFSIFTLYITIMMAIFVNMISKRLRESYPKRQGTPGRWKILELPKKNGKQIITGNKIYILDYSIGRFEYKYYGNNKIKEIKTQSIEDNDHKGEHYKFIAEMTFNQKITDGILMYR